DGIRVDAVSSMLKLNYSREHGQWEPNEFGGNGNLEAIAFIKDLNETIYRDFPDVQTIAEEATDWPRISRPTFMDGMGFGMKWMMGWMHDTFRYFKTEHIFRPHDQNLITFSMMYFYDEHFMLPLSHDEVVHGKSPMIYKMRGLEHQKWANLRVLYAYMVMHPGAKLLFMGNEWGQTSEWNEDRELDWHLLQHDAHRGLKRCVRDLLHLYRKHPALYQQQFDSSGFQWIEVNRRQDAVLAFIRKGKRRADDVFVIMNLSDQSFDTSSFTLQGKIAWTELLNTNHPDYGGDGTGINASLVIDVIDKKKRMVILKPAIPPLSIAIFG
ncbi:MAG: alpha amylase C-terminal domain-containing protein, partial [Ferruginibacter sp.]